MAHLGADLSKVQTQTYDPIPPGEYTVQVTDSSVAMTKSSNKPMLKVTYTVRGGPFNGRKVFDNFLIGNEVAMSRMKTLATVGGHLHPDMINDSDELHGMELIIGVKLKKEEGNYPPGNSVSHFKKIEGKALPPMPSAPPVFAPLPVAPPVQAHPLHAVTPPFQFAQTAQSAPSADSQPAR